MSCTTAWPGSGWASSARSSTTRSANQRELYKGIREQLDGLADAKTNPAAVAELSQVDAELARIHRELTDHARAVGERPDGGSGKSLHELVGDWLTVDVPSTLDVARVIADVPLEKLVPLEREVREVLERSLKEQFPTNPWSTALGIDLAQWLEHPVDDWRRRVDAVHEAARAVDATMAPEVPDLAPDLDVRAQGDARAALADRLAPLVEHGDDAMFTGWAGAEPARIARAIDAVAAVEPYASALERATQDPELALVLQSQPPGIGDMVLWIGQLAAYLAIARKWYRFICFGRKREALQVLQRFGLALGAAAAERVNGVLSTARARELVRECHHQLLPGVAVSELTNPQLVQSLRRQRELLEALRLLEKDAALRPIASRVRADLRSAATRRSLLDGLRRSKGRAAAIAALEDSLGRAGLFSAAVRADVGSSSDRGTRCWRR